MHSVVHGLLYLLNPTLLGDGMSGENRFSLKETLIRKTVDDVHSINKVRMELLYLQYTQFMITVNHQNQDKSFCFQILAKQKKPLSKWWLTNGADFNDLQKIAIKIFSIATSRSALERNFLTTGFIHSKLRNSLSPNNNKKLVLINYNLATFYDWPVPTWDNFEQSTSDDNSEAE